MKSKTKKKDLLFFSTLNFVSKDIESIINLCRKYSIYSLQFGPGFTFNANLLQTIKCYGNEFRFLLHNYLPCHNSSFLMNIGSLNDRERNLSINYCKKAIDFSKILGAPFYSVHSAFCFEALPNFFKNKNRKNFVFFNKDKVYKKFLESTIFLNNYAKLKGLKFIIENNVISSLDLTNGFNQIVLMADARDLLRIIKDVNSKNFGLLIDFGHLKVASNTLVFNKFKFMEKVFDYTLALHLSDNDGRLDQHRAFDSKAWFLPFLKEYKDRYVIVEGNRLNVEEILRCRDVVRKALV